LTKGLSSKPLIFNWDQAGDFRDAPRGQAPDASAQHRGMVRKEIQRKREPNETRMQTKLFRFFAIGLQFTTTFLTACSATRDGRETQAGGTAIGAVTGAAIGAGLGALSRRNIGQMAAAGAAVGAAAGYAWGSDVAKRKAKYASDEAWLESEIDFVRTERKKALATNRALRLRLSKLSKKVTQSQIAGDPTAMLQIRLEIESVKSETESVLTELNLTAGLAEAISRETDNSEENLSSKKSTLRMESSALKKEIADAEEMRQRIKKLEQLASK
jgi:hypothetical protein